ncbi:hypothetical protein VTN49DRAFT_5998 [Thermomyces lanuginosus]|uniref:uncharacterized protein n=1 Tax=Thermomyces lanuginosus TaxID=5541 RepID=UPI003742E834
MTRGSALAPKRPRPRQNRLLNCRRGVQSTDGRASGQPQAKEGSPRRVGSPHTQIVHSRSVAGLQKAEKRR